MGSGKCLIWFGTLIDKMIQGPRLGSTQNVIKRLVTSLCTQRSRLHLLSPPYQLDPELLCFKTNVLKCRHPCVLLSGLLILNMKILVGIIKGWDGFCHCIFPRPATILSAPVRTNDNIRPLLYFQKPCLSNCLFNHVPT